MLPWIAQNTDLLHIKLPAEPNGPISFRIDFCEAEMAERNARKKDGGKDKKKKANQRENSNLHHITRLCRLIFKELGSNRKLEDWNSVRRNLTSDGYWTCVGRGGHKKGDLGQDFVETNPGTFMRQAAALQVGLLLRIPWQCADRCLALSRVFVRKYEGGKIDLE